MFEIKFGNCSAITELKLFRSVTDINVLFCLETQNFSWSSWFRKISLTSLLNLSTSNRQVIQIWYKSNGKLVNKSFNTLERCYFGFYGNREEKNLQTWQLTFQSKRVTLNMWQRFCLLQDHYCNTIYGIFFVCVWLKLPTS